MTDPLFQPFTLGKLNLKNRIVMAPMTRQRSPDGVPGENVAAYYRRRAEGGVGLIITEGVGIDVPAAIDGPSIPLMYGDDALAGWKRVVDEVHAAGAPIFPQLWHQGVLRDPLVSKRPDVDGQRPSGHWGTPGNYSLKPEFVARMLPVTRPMTDDEIADVIAAYGRAARDAVAVGFDGIAIHGAHGYLIDTFMWADTNRRSDRFGGEAKNRALFGAEVVRAIRAAIGPDKPIMFRFSHHKQQDYDALLAPTPGELGILLGTLADAGVDIFDASSRRFDKPIYPGSDLPSAAWAKKLTGKPSMAVGGIGLNNGLQDTLKQRGQTMAIDNLDAVRRLMNDGAFDLAAVGRALISDADWPKRAKAGAPFTAYDRSSLERLH